MPIDTSSDGWRDSKKSTVKEDVISFLESNRGQAYSVRELSDEVLSTNWEARHEEDRDGSDAPEVDDGLADLQADQRATTSLVAVLDQLVDEGKVECRVIEPEHHDIPYEETFLYCSYIGE